MMPEYLSPGVYVEETSADRGPISPSATSTTAFVGATLKGPLNTATQVSSVAEYREIFGDILPASPVSLAVLQFFSNGGRQAVLVRTAAARARAVHSDLVGDFTKSTGIHALGNSPSPGLLVTPDASAMNPREHGAAVKSVLAYCEEHRIFYIIDAPQSRSRQNQVDTVIDWAGRSNALRHPNAAVYFPRVKMSDPLGKSSAIISAGSGAVAGIYARTDSQHGVWRAPAGTQASLLGISGVEIGLSEDQMERLKSAAINPLRSFPGRGILAWGARTFASTDSDSEWRYVSMRRVLLFIERSVYDGLQWTVFEPNGEPLWAQIRLAVSSFLNHLFRRGAFAGAGEREAYFVKCGRDTMTPTDIRDGRIKMMVGFAPLKPAEFVVVRFEFRAADSN
jgi:phage tail sheath protein FI